MEAKENQNFISCDKKTVRNSYGDFFTVGEVVGHQGAKDTATILSFTPDIESNEITAITDKGTAHLDFLIKKEPEKFYFCGILMATGPIPT